MHAHLIGLLISLLVFFAVVACLLVRGGAINERDGMKQRRDEEQRRAWADRLSAGR